MFDELEAAPPVPKDEYRAREPGLRTELLELQRELKRAKVPVIVLVAGVEAAGKGDVVARLCTWLDARGVSTFAFWEESDEERERPAFWRFWRCLPPDGRTAVFFGSWYTRPIVDRVYGRLDKQGFKRALRRATEFERLLVDHGTLVVKLWFHLSKKTQRSRIERASEEQGLASPYARKFAKRYGEFIKVSEAALKRTDQDHAPWHLIDSEDRRHRDLAAGEILRDAMDERLARAGEASGPVAAAPMERVEASSLERLDLDATLEEADYERALERHQQALGGLAWRARAAGRQTVALFEGWDAAGKGGAIRRVTAAMDARLYRVVSVGAPSDEERAHPYLWRFWRRLPRAGYMTIYDRSWYGRVLVERVEGFASPAQWQRSYREINEFEEQLVEHGVVLMKFWIHIRPETQLARFEERQRTPWKRHKITDEDWRNRERWDDYRAAVEEMLERTHTGHAPWTVVSGEDKRHARIEVLRTFRGRLEAALGD